MNRICPSCFGLVKAKNADGPCDACRTLPANVKVNSNSNMFYRQEREDFLNSRRNDAVLFAYSGGLDSTVALSQLIEECKSRSITVIPFTIDYGFKGKETWKNISQVIDFLHQNDKYFVYDISSESVSILASPSAKNESMKVFDFYKSCVKEGVLPCGAMCNSIIDWAFQRILKNYNDEYLITGGDTPKRNTKGIYSIFWETHGFTVVRAGAAFGNTKNKNRQYILEHNIPWNDPGCGGYDTDCLLPGAVFYALVQGRAEHSLEETAASFPVLMEYFSERVRLGVIERNDALESLLHYDLPSLESIREIDELCGR